jgi:vacuolar-type H+-ATPase subunit I/STV1
MFILGLIIGIVCTIAIYHAQKSYKQNLDHEVNDIKKAYGHIIKELGNEWLNEAFNNVCEKITISNYDSQVKKLDKAVLKCTKLGLTIGDDSIEEMKNKLDLKYRSVLELQRAKDEQNRIKEIMKEEKAAERLRLSELKAIEKETKLILKKKKEMEERISLLHELESLSKISDEQRIELQEATKQNLALEEELAKKERAKSMAEQTKAGNVYIISNIGSFGENIYKIGMTRRLIPEDRVRELGDASVPFPFDIHFMISSDDAPKLESLLHEKFWSFRYNFVNDRKEFFKVDIQTIKEVIEKECRKGTYQFYDTDLASEWHESNSLRDSKNSSKYDRSNEVDDEELDEAA